LDAWFVFSTKSGDISGLSLDYQNLEILFVNGLDGVLSGRFLDRERFLVDLSELFEILFGLLGYF